MINSYRRRSYRDASIVRRVRHNDGLKEIVGTVKRKVQETVDNFKKMSGSEKIVYLLKNLAKACIALFLVKGVADLKKRVGDVEESRKVLLWYTNKLNNDQRNANNKKFGVLKQKIDGVLGLSKAAVESAKEQIAKVVPSGEPSVTRTIGQNSGGTGKVHLAGGGYKGSTSIAGPF